MRESRIFFYSFLSLVLLYLLFFFLFIQHSTTGGGNRPGGQLGLVFEFQGLRGEHRVKGATSLRSWDLTGGDLLVGGVVLIVISFHLCFFYLFI